MTDKKNSKKEPLSFGDYKLNDLGRVNIILGKNGCGKSILLRELDKSLSTPETGVVKYVTPERGGILKYDPGVDQSITANSNWLRSQRSKNRHEGFRQQSAAQFRNLEVLFFREMAKDERLRKNMDYQFDRYINRINLLLENIEIKQAKTVFEIYKKGKDEKISPDAISSGESELIALAIECLVFEKECVADKSNYLMLDEPDVHLHPDLQAKLCKLLIEIVKEEKDATIIIATHSTAILGALLKQPQVHIGFMHSGQKELNFKDISTEYHQILPIFGAHSLSNIFNDQPIFLVEGGDDVRIWQQAVRSSGGKLNIYPCSAGSISELKKCEDVVNKIINSIYDNARAYSLRDRDDDKGEQIDDNDNIKRFKLSCRSAENLLLTDEVLNSCNVSWDEFKEKIEDWLKTNSAHDHFSAMESFKNENFPRKTFNLKEIRNDLLSILGSSCNWELLVGKCIGKHCKDQKFTLENNSIGDYLGEKLISILINDQ